LNIFYPIPLSLRTAFINMKNYLDLENSFDIDKMQTSLLWAERFIRKVEYKKQYFKYFFKKTRLEKKRKNLSFIVKTYV